MTSSCRSRFPAPRSKPRSFLAVAALLVLSCLVQGEDSGEALLVDEILWQGYPDGLLLPGSVRTRLLFETRLLEREIGQVPQWKVLSFKDWRAWNGRLVPRRLEFDDGLSRRVLELVDLAETSGVTRRSFQPPLEQEKDREKE